MKLIDIINDYISDFLIECTIAAIYLDDGVVLAKNRDRGYVAIMEVVHEIVDDVEMVYWRDIDTDWSEGMNEYGFGIVNSSLLVRQDEKEGDKVTKKQSKGDEKLSNDEREKELTTASDGAKLRKALTYTKMRDIITSIISYDGGDKKKSGVKGEIFVGSPRNIFIIETTSKDSPIISKLKKEDKLDVRTNHGISHKQAGYTYGIKKESSHKRLDYAKEHLKDVKTDLEVIDKMKEQYDKNKFFNPYRMKNQYNMSTVGQIMMNLSKKEVTIRMDGKMGKFEGLDDRLPEGYKPKIKIKIESEKSKDNNGKKLPS